MTLPDVLNEWTVGYIVNLQGPEPLGADPVLVRARRPSLDLLVSLCVRITRWP
jgi:hypothetical protein